MKKSKLFAFLASACLVGGVVSCGCSGKKPEDPVPPGPTPVEPDKPDTPDKPVVKPTIKVVEHLYGKTIIGEHKEEVGSDVAIYARPDYGFKPVAKVNGKELELEKGNGTFKLVEGENTIDVSYVPVEENITEISANYEKAFAELLKIAGDNTIEDKIISSNDPNHATFEYMSGTYNPTNILGTDIGDIDITFDKANPGILRADIRVFDGLAKDYLFIYEVDTRSYSKAHLESLTLKKAELLDSGDDEGTGLDITDKVDSAAKDYKEKSIQFLESGLINIKNTLANYKIKYTCKDLAIAHYGEIYEVKRETGEFLNHNPEYQEEMRRIVSEMEANTVNEGIIFEGVSGITNFDILNDSRFVDTQNYSKYLTRDCLRLMSITPLNHKKERITEITLIDLPLNGENNIRVSGFSLGQIKPYEITDDKVAALDKYCCYVFDYDIDKETNFGFTTSTFMNEENGIKPYGMTLDGMNVSYKEFNFEITEANKNYMKSRVLYNVKTTMQNLPTNYVDLSKLDFDYSDTEAGKRYVGLQYIPDDLDVKKNHENAYVKLRKMIREGAGSTLEENKRVDFVSDTMPNLKEPDPKYDNYKFVATDEELKFNLGFVCENPSIPGRKFEVRISLPKINLENYNAHILLGYTKDKTTPTVYYQADFDAERLVNFKNIIPSLKQVLLEDVNTDLSVDFRTEIPKKDLVEFENFYEWGHMFSDIFYYLFNSVLTPEEFMSLGYRSFN